MLYVHDGHEAFAESNQTKIWTCSCLAIVLSKFKRDTCNAASPIATAVHAILPLFSQVRPGVKTPARHSSSYSFLQLGCVCGAWAVLQVSGMGAWVHGPLLTAAGGGAWCRTCVLYGRAGCKGCHIIAPGLRAEEQLVQAISIMFPVCP